VLLPNWLLQLRRSRRRLKLWRGVQESGHPILPLAAHQSRTLTYPVGVADLDQIAGKPFDREAFAEIPMLIVHGAADTNSSLPTTDEPSDSYSNAHACSCQTCV
jgi:hypothetical protein